MVVPLFLPVSASFPPFRSHSLYEISNRIPEDNISNWTMWERAFACKCECVHEQGEEKGSKSLYEYHLYVGESVYDDINRHHSM